MAISNRATSDVERSRALGAPSTASVEALRAVVRALITDVEASISDVELSISDVEGSISDVEGSITVVELSMSVRKASLTAVRCLLSAVSGLIPAVGQLITDSEPLITDGNGSIAQSSTSTARVDHRPGLSRQLEKPGLTLTSLGEALIARVEGLMTLNEPLLSDGSTKGGFARDLRRAGGTSIPLLSTWTAVIAALITEISAKPGFSSCLKRRALVSTGKLDRLTAAVDRSTAVIRAFPSAIRHSTSALDGSTADVEASRAGVACLTSALEAVLSLGECLLTLRRCRMPIEQLLFGHPTPRTSYSVRQLRDTLTSLRNGIAGRLPADTQLAFLRGTTRTRAQVLDAIDSELAAFAAFDVLLIKVKQDRLALQKRLPLMAAAIGVLRQALGLHVGPEPHLRKAIGLAPKKKPRKLKPEERMEATLKLRATRARNGTATKKPRKR